MRCKLNETRKGMICVVVELQGIKKKYVVVLETYIC